MADLGEDLAVLELHGAAALARLIALGADGEHPAGTCRTVLLHEVRAIAARVAEDRMLVVVPRGRADELWAALSPSAGSA
jgi:sarcosine oxidase gamma subunit